MGGPGWRVIREDSGRLSVVGSEFEVVGCGLWVVGSKSRLTGGLGKHLQALFAAHNP